MENPVVDKADRALKRVTLKVEEKPYPLAISINAMIPERVSKREKKVFISVEWKKSLILPLNRVRSKEKSKVPKIISWDVIISTPKELYAPILEALLENPPVDREHIAWMHESRRLMPTILYSKIPRTKKARYRRVMVFAVFLILGFTLSMWPSASYNWASSLPLKKRSIIMTKPRPPIYWNMALYR